VWRILKRLGMNRLPASARYQRRALRWKRYEKQRPGHQLQVDVKFIEPLGQTGRRRKFYQFTAIDDCTRLRVLRLPALRPEDRHRLHRRRHGQAAVRRRAGANRHSSLVVPLRSLDCPAGGVRIEGSGTRSSSLLD
jgi:hypothetical protein